MMTAVGSYLAVRRAAGFTLSNPECLLRSFARFAAERQQTHIRTATVIEWASLAPRLRNGTRAIRRSAVLGSTFG